MMLLARRFLNSIFLLLSILVLFFVGQALALRHYSQSFYFQDETDHVTMGWVMDRYGSKLYRDLSTNHQPLPVLAGAAIMKVVPTSKATNLYVVIEIIRWCMFLLAVVTSVVLVLRFRWVGLLTSLLTQSLVYYFFGWHVLGESLAAPLVAFTLCLVLEPLAGLALRPKWWPQRVDQTLFGLSLFGLIFSLLPTWPYCALVGILALSQWKTRRATVVMLASVGIPTLGLLFFITPQDWWRESVLNNLLYYSPTDKERFNWLGYIKLVLYPLTSWLRLDTNVGRYFAGLSAIGLAALLWFKQHQKIIKKWPQILAILLAVMSLNLRVNQPGVVFFEAFHLWPYLVAVSCIAAFILYRWALDSRQIKIVVAIIVVILLANNLDWWWHNLPDRMSQNYIYYSTYQTLGDGIREIAPSGSTLLSAPDGHGYLNQVAQVPIAGRQLFHLNWAWASPRLQQEYLQLLATQPPTFAYITQDSPQEQFIKALEPLLATQYQEIFWANGKTTNVFMYQPAMAKVTSEQWQKFAELGFKIATIKKGR